MRPRNVLLTAAAILIAAVPAIAGPKPIWVDNPPRDARFFHGVGSSEDHQSAKDLALRDLAASIKVKVKGETKNVYQERGEQVSDDYESSVETMVDTTLSGVKYETWQDPADKLVWTHAFLSKAKFWEPRTKARKVAVQYFERGRAALQKGRAANALKLLLQCQAALGKYWPLPFEITVDGKSQIFLIAAEDELRSLGGDLTITADDATIDAKVGKPVKKPLVVVAAFKESPVAKLPIRYGWASCKGRLKQSVQTGKSGKAKTKVTNFMGGSRRCEVTAAVDLETLLGGVEGADEAMMKRLSRTLERVGLPKVSFFLSTQKIRAAVRVVDFDAKGADMGESQLGNSVAEALRESGFTVRRRGVKLTKDEILDLLDGDDSVLDKVPSSKLDLLVVGRVKLRLQESKGEDSFGLGGSGYTVARGRATLHAIELKTGNVFAKADSTKVKGLAFDDAKAMVEAQKAACKIAPDFVEKIKQHLQK